MLTVFIGSGQYLASCWVSHWTTGRSPQGQEPIGHMTGAHRTNVANEIWPGLLCLAPVQQWGYKKPRHHLIAVSSKKETFSLYIPAEDKFLLAMWPGREQEEKGEYREFSPSWGSEGSLGHHKSHGTGPLVTMTTQVTRYCAQVYQGT